MFPPALFQLAPPPRTPAIVVRETVDFLKWHITEVILHTLSYSSEHDFMRFIHVVAASATLSICEVSSYCVVIKPLFNHSPLYRLLGQFQFVHITKTADKNDFVQTFFGNAFISNF